MPSNEPSSAGFRAAYLNLLESGELAQRVHIAYQHLEECDLCARYCQINRRKTTKGARKKEKGSAAPVNWPRCIAPVPTTVKRIRCAAGTVPAPSSSVGATYAVCSARIGRSAKKVLVTKSHRRNWRTCGMQFPRSGAHYPRPTLHRSRAASSRSGTSYAGSASGHQRNHAGDMFSAGWLSRADTTPLTCPVPET